MISSAFAADVDGEWNMMLTSAEGGATIPMTISVDGEIATATAGNEEFTGTYINGEIKLKGSLYVADAGMASMLDMTAKFAGDELKGTANWDMYVADVHGTRK